MSRFYLMIISAALLTACAPQGKVEMSKGPASDVRHQMDKWADTVASHSPEKLDKFYAQNAVIHSPFEAKSVEGEKARLAFFKELFAKYPWLKVLPDEQKVVVDGDTAVGTGLFTYGYERKLKWITVP